ncbi:uncharacterized protein TNCV_4519571 [Trichonephila clavipes]|nr:uncharacterized protein TNCV_4519571 [Trichonephila clavipes]
MEIRTGSSDSNSSRHKSSNFESVQRRSKEWQYGRKKGSGVKRELEGKGISFQKDRGEMHTGTTDKRGPLVRSPLGSWSEPNRKLKMSRKETLGKKVRTEKTVMSSTSGYNLRPRRGAKVESRPTNEKRIQQGGRVRARRSPEQYYSPYIEEQARSSSRNTRSRSSQKQN